ncbi:MAG: hypothetical protein ABIZ80_03000 [Bryobacteraceae bacterium]
MRFTALFALAAACSAQVIDIGSRRELFVDRYLIEDLKNTRLEMQKPIDRGVVVKYDKPWEGAFSNYTTIIHDGPKYRLYYRGIPTTKKELESETVTAYAESSDGIHWTKPDLGIISIKGSTRNNAILNDVAFSSDFSPFLDKRPGVPAAEKYKGLGGTMRTGLVAFASADGLHWRKMREEPVFPITKQPSFDSQNLAFWSESEGRYVAYYRTFKTFPGLGRVRWITRSTSDDFLNWTTPQEMSFGDAPPEHLYVNQTGEYFRAPHIYISIAARFMPGRRALTDEEIKQADIMEGYYKDISDVVLLTTRGGTKYDRTFQESFIRPGPGPKNWASRTNYPVLNVVQTSPTEMSVYINRDYATPTNHINRYTLRLDGFASVYAPYAGGEMVTRPFTFSGKELEINYATSAAGGIRVEVQDASGKPIPGLALADTQEIIGDHIARTVTWKSGSGVAALAGKPVRLRFVMKDADLYSMRFKD